MAHDEDSWLENVSLGESLRGLQDLMGGNTEIGAQQQAMSRLRSQMGGGARQQAAAQFNKHMPLQRTIASPYKDSTQIGVLAKATLTPANWAGGANPTITGVTRLYQSFKPQKAIATEYVRVTYENASAVTATRTANPVQADDAILIQAFAGSYNCFPNAPNAENGVSGATFAPNSLGNGISWPTLNPGIDISIGWAITEGVLYQAQPPAGFTTDDITSIYVEIRFNLLGVSLR